MSIVGTRPPLISETNLYEPHHKVMLTLFLVIFGVTEIHSISMNFIHGIWSVIL